MAVVSGEVMHVIKCVPTAVKRRETKECYQELPVLRGNTSMFMSPKSHILLKTGTQIDCNPYVPVMYLLQGTWYKITPQAASTLPPNELQPSTSHTWTYSNPADLATTGIYSLHELNQLRDHIMFPAERPAVLNTIARSFTGQQLNRQGVSFINLLDEESLQKIAASTWSRLWGWFTGFGTFSAGMFGCWVVFKLLKFILDTALHGYALHQVYGWSIHLLGSLWDSVTNTLIHLKNLRKSNVNSIEPGDDTEKQTSEAVEEIEQVQDTTTVYRPTHNGAYYSRCQ